MSSYSLDNLRESMVKILNVEKESVAGSGFIIREDGYLITCHHVIYLLNSLTVEYLGNIYEADWCEEFSNPEVDIAVLKIDINNAKAVPIINPQDLSTSVKVYGFPPNKSNNFPQGIDVDGENITPSAPVKILSTYRSTQIKTNNLWNKLPQENSTFLSHRIDAKVESGSSGGAVFAEDLGGVVGVIQCSKSDTSYVIRWDNIRDELEKLNLEPEKNAVCRFLEDIENNFKYIQLFHSKQQIVLKEQYIPIQVSLETKRKDVEDFFIREIESGEELKRVYAMKVMGEETQRTQVDWKEAKQKHEKIMVLADPGMGKSTLLRMEAGLKAVEERLNLASNSSSQREARIDNIIFPLFIRLSDLDEKPGEVIDIIPDIIQRNYPKTASGILHLLKEKLQQGKCWLFLDALDEVPKENRNDLKDKLNRFTRNYPCRIICTSRIVGYGGAFVDGAKEVEIVPFSHKQTEEYIQTWFTNAADYIEDDSVSAEKLITELREKPQISGLTQNPLLLSLVCSLYQTKGLELPARKAQVYQKAVDYMLREWRNDNNRLASEDGWVIAKIELLESLAYQFSCEGKEVFTLREIRDDINKFLESGKGNDFRNITTTELIRELCEDDGIIQKLTREGEQYLFLHRTFQEYFTAAYLNRAIEENKSHGIDLARKLFWEYDFHETLILLAGLMENPFPLIKAIANEKDDIFKTQLLLAGRCVAECQRYREENQKFVEKIVDRIYKLWLCYRFRYRYCNTSLIESIESTVLTLGKSHSQMVYKLIFALDLVSDDAAQALAKIGNSIATEGLITAINDSNSFTRLNLVNALGKIGNPIVTQRLITFLNNSDSHVRRNAVEALGKIGNSIATEGLITALNDSDSDVRYCAVKALGNIGNSIATEGLITALNHSNSDVRRNAAFFFGKIGNPIATEELITALNDSDYIVRRNAVEALGKIGNSIATEGLITALNDSDYIVRRDAALALGKIGNPIATEELITALNHSDYIVRRDAALALGNIGNPIATQRLITALNHSNSDVRYWAVEALGKIGNPIATEGLITALNHSDYIVRSCAVEALGKIGNPIAIEELITALNHSDYIVRRNAAFVLGKIGNPIATEELITTLNHSDYIVRRDAALALGKIGNPIATEVLITALNDSDYIVRRDAALALGNIGNSIATEGLITALNHSNSNVRYCAVEALDKIGNPIATKRLITTALNDSDPHVRWHAVDALAKIGNPIATEVLLITTLNHCDDLARRDAMDALAKIGNAELLKKIIQSPEIDIYDKNIFSLARTLALRFSKKPPLNKKGQPLIPVHPELVRFKQAWLFCKTVYFIFLQNF